MLGAQFAAFGILFLVIIGGAIVVAVFYLKNLQDLLKEVSEKNRQVPPGNVWLMFIPLFNIIYPFILYPKICDSVKAEYSDRDIPAEGDFARGIGITMPILGLVGFVPVLGGLAGIANLVLFIIFWSKTAGFKDKLRRTPKGEGSGNLGMDSSDLLDA